MKKIRYGRKREKERMKRSKKIRKRDKRKNIIIFFLNPY
jgi:hypothetical protein